MFLAKEESRIASLVAEGCTNAEIGDLIGYSPDAIKKKLSRIYKIFKTKNRKTFISIYCKYKHLGYLNDKPATDYRQDIKILRKNYINK